MQSWPRLPTCHANLLGRVTKSIRIAYLFKFFIIKLFQQTGGLGDLEGLRGLQCWKCKPAELRAAVDTCGAKQLFACGCLTGDNAVYSIASS